MTSAAAGGGGRHAVAHSETGRSSGVGGSRGRKRKKGLIVHSVATAHLKPTRVASKSLTQSVFALNFHVILASFQMGWQAALCLLHAWIDFSTNHNPQTTADYTVTPQADACGGLMVLRGVV